MAFFRLCDLTEPELDRAADIMVELGGAENQAQAIKAIKAHISAETSVCHAVHESRPAARPTPWWS